MKKFQVFYEEQLGSYTIYLYGIKKMMLHLFSRSANWQKWPLPLVAIKAKATPESIKLHRLYRDVNESRS